MKSVLLFLLLATAALVSAQQFQDVFFIDDFQVETPIIVIIIPNNPNFPLTDTRIVTGADSEIIGTERDLLLTVESGDPNLVLSSGVAAGSFTCSTPNEASGNSLIQWDGVDGDLNLDPAGLGGRDFRSQNAEALRVFGETDITTTIDIRIYSGSVGAVCTHTLTVPGGDNFQEFIIDYTDFTGGCDFSNVGAVEMQVDMGDNVDVLIELLSAYGPVPLTPSRTRTRTRTRTPTPSNSPPPSDTCVCRCPIFVCEVFRVDDGNYYFYNFDYDFFFFGTTFFGGFGTFFNFFTQFFYYFDPYFYQVFFYDYYFFFDYYFFGFFGNFFFDPWYLLFFN